MRKVKALLALFALPAVASIRVAPLRPGDVIVFECDEHIDATACERIKSLCKQVWPKNKVIVLDKGLRLRTIAGEAA